MDSSPHYLEKDTIDILKDAVDKLESSFSGLPSLDTNLRDEEAVKAILLEIAERFKADYPYFHPLYAGQMLKPPHPMARSAYMLALWMNPNNHALDGGRRDRPDVRMERTFGTSHKRRYDGKS
jgi:tyrosine decarboxylase/aspartate 1-decarboxylase